MLRAWATNNIERKQTSGRPLQRDQENKQKKRNQKKRKEKYQKKKIILATTNHLVTKTWKTDYTDFTCNTNKIINH